MKHYARYYHPGAFFSEETTVELAKRDPRYAADNAPESAFCFVLYDTSEAPDLGPDFTVVPKQQNTSGRYYLGGEAFTQAEVADMGPDFDILASNMRGNKWERIIRTRSGNWQPLEDRDEVIR